MESWKKSIFKKQTAPCSPSYRRSLSEPACADSELRTSLKIHAWCGPVKSKRKKSECAVSILEKPLCAYRWQKHPSFRWKGGRGDGKRDLEEAQPEILPEMVDGPEVLGTSPERLNLLSTQSRRSPFSRSISEPEPCCSTRPVRPGPTLEGPVEAEQQGYFIRGIFSTLSNGFSRILNLKGESTNEPTREGIL